MKRIIIILLLLSFVTPVHARMVMKQDPIESDLITQQPADDASSQKKKQTEQDLNREFKKSGAESAKQAPEKSGSNWWKWALGAVIIGGVAAAAGAGHNGVGSSGSDTGSIASTW